MKLSLRLLNLPVGLLINFGAATFKEGIRRVVNNHQDFAPSRLRVSMKVGSTRRRHSPCDGKLSAGIVGQPPSG
ncbi:MAG: hypothetical protein D4Q77_00110 [Methanothrix sp.]|nr:MAG: hypothetical protein D4Q77_00110 [Methanothrix sp.]